MKLLVSVVSCKIVQEDFHRADKHTNKDSRVAVTLVGVKCSRIVFWWKLWVFGFCEEYISFTWCLLTCHCWHQFRPQESTSHPWWKLTRWWWRVLEARCGLPTPRCQTGCCTSAGPRSSVRLSIPDVKESKSFWYSTSKYGGSRSKTLKSHSACETHRQTNVLAEKNTDNLYLFNSSERNLWLLVQWHTLYIVCVF